MSIKCSRKDGGYGWIIVWCSFFNLFVISGSLSDFGLLLPYMKISFHNRESALLLIPSIMYIGYFGTGLITGTLADKLGCRPVALVGALISSVGLVASVFAVHIYMLVICSGLLLGIAVAGSGIGYIVFPPIIQLCLETYGWRGTMLMKCAFVLQTCVTSILMLPFSKPSNKSAMDKQQGSSLVSIHISHLSASSMLTLSGINTQNDSAKENNKKSRSLKRYCDLSVVKNIYANLFMLTYLLHGANSIDFVFVPLKCFMLGFSAFSTTFILSCMGVMNAVGRILFGYIGLHVNLTLLYGLCFVFNGICMILTAPFENFWVILFTASGISLFFGGHASLCMATPIEYIGYENYGRMHGFLLIGSTIGFCTTPQLAAYIREQTGSYDKVFIVCGLLPLLSALLVIVIALLRAFKVVPVYSEDTMDVKPDDVHSTHSIAENSIKA